MAPAFLVEILEEMLAWKFLAGPDNFSDPPVSHPQLPELAALTFEIET